MPAPRDLNAKQYEKELLRLQTELVYMQEWIVVNGQRLVVIFEGRDTAGKDGVIKRIIAFLNPRGCRVVALPTPSEREAGHRFVPEVVEAFPGEITAISVSKPTLEDVFIRRTGHRFWNQDEENQQAEAAKKSKKKH